MSGFAIVLDSNLAQASGKSNKSRSRPPWLSAGVISGAIRASYCLILILSAFVAHRLVNGNSVDINLAQIFVVLASATQILFMPIQRVYDYRCRNKLPYSVKLTVYWWSMFILMSPLIYITRIEHLVSFAWIGTWFVCGLSALLITSSMINAQFRRWRHAGLIATTTAVVGTGDAYNHLIAHLSKLSDRSIKLVGTFHDTLESLSYNAANEQTMDARDEFVRFARLNQIDQIILALPWHAEARIQVWLKSLAALPSDILLCPPAITSWSVASGACAIGNIPLLKISERPISGWNYILKAMEDRLLGLLFLGLSCPAMLVIAVLIKLDSPGPVLFRQTRYGYNNSLIEVLKFRTMRTAVPERDGEAITQATRFDCRVTRVGRWLRRTSLDELPQLFNVVKGQMSLVGPRPHAVAHNEKYQTIVEAYLARHRVKPGITGWAQVNGYRGETDTDEKMVRRVEHDLYYIDHWSLQFDLSIIVRTIFFGFIHPNAY